VTARDRTVLMVVVVLAAMGAFWFLSLAPKRDEISVLNAKIAAAQNELDVAEEGARTAEQAKARYADDYATVARLGKAVPADDDVPSLLFQLETAARQSKVDFRSIRLEATGTEAATAVSTPAATAAAVGNVEKGGAGTTPVAATEAAAAVLPPGASIGSAGFPTMPFTFAFQGSFKKLEAFLDRLKRFTQVNGKTIRVRGRLLTINGVGLTAGPKGFPQMKAQIAATAYLLPSDQAVIPPLPSTAPASGAPSSTTTTPTPAASSGATPVAPAATLTPGASR